MSRPARPLGWLVVSVALAITIASPSPAGEGKTAKGSAGGVPAKKR